jgi:glycosyltransferase involved in cell wall biosynthesis
MRVIFIGNYTPDKQESMQRFSDLLYNGFKGAGYECEIWKPPVVAGRLFTSSVSGIAKWLGYIDKWILFPLILQWRVRKKSFHGTETRFHVCDHSNAPYLKFLPSENTAITCHDVLAIRGALGYKDAYCPTSVTGKVLQKWILSNLTKAKILATASRLTLNQLEMLSKYRSGDKRDWRIIHLGFNATFAPMEPALRNTRLKSVGLDSDTPFILHVGSSHPRKNRMMLIDMAAVLGDRWTGKICYAGQGVDEKLMTHAHSLGVAGRIISVVNPDHDMLVALYSGCYAFIWPSFSEGFGWPLIEAQACGAPVISSNFDPMPEVSNNSALHADPTDPKEFAEAFLKLSDENFRAEIIRKGLENSNSFKPDKMINSYLALHGLKPR